MPEGHTVHRLAAAFEDAFAGQRVRASSPQGRFPEAAEIDGFALTRAEAAGKHLLLAFAPSADVDPAHPPTRFVHVHLGLYGSWTFAGAAGALPHAIGAPRTRVTQQAPRPTVRLRIAGAAGLADLTGPTRCALIDHAGRREILARLGPDPLRADADPARFVTRVRSSRSAIGALLMNQEAIAGIGNIYRAELLFRARLDPFVPGRDLTRPMVEGMWEDLVPLMRYGERTGRIVTTQPEHRDLHAVIRERSRGARQNGDQRPQAVPREKSFYVYHRQSLPCRVCGTLVRSGQIVSRAVYWCPRCQSTRSRRAPWSRQHPATAWTEHAVA